jgi:hypothetical protein
MKKRRGKVWRIVIGDNIEYLISNSLSKLIKIKYLNFQKYKGKNLIIMMKECF